MKNKLVYFVKIEKESCIRIKNEKQSGFPVQRLDDKAILRRES